MHTHLSGHVAYFTTYNKVIEKYYWPNLRKDVKEFCATCLNCTANRSSTTRAFLHPFQVADRPFALVNMDFYGPIKPPSPHGNKYIAVMSCYFSKWVELAPMPDLRAETEVLMQHIVARHGPMKALVSDLGSQFTSKVFRALCNILGVKHIHRLSSCQRWASRSSHENYVGHL